jgi:hypothetical protein
MRRSFLVLTAVAFSLSVATLNNACSGDDTSATSPDAETSEAGTTVCDFYTGVGKPCSPISDLRCFPICTKGGAFCRAGPDGTGVWVNVNDDSCMPDSAPDLGDGSIPDDTDSGMTTDDGSVTDASDAGSTSTSDASDGAIEADILDASDSG